MYRSLCAYLELLVLKAHQSRLSSDTVGVSVQLNEYKYMYIEREREQNGLLYFIILNSGFELVAQKQDRTRQKS